MNNSLRNKFEALCDSYGEKLPEKIKNIRSQFENLSSNWDFTLFEDLRRAIHSLSGSSGVYGYEKLADVCRKLDDYLNKYDATMTLSPAAMSTIQTYINQMSEVISYKPQADHMQKFNLAHKPCLDNQKQIWVLGADTAFTTELKDKLNENIEVIFLHDFSAISKLAMKKLNVMTLIINVDELSLDQASEIDNVRLDVGAAVPIVCIAKKSDFETRLKAVRAGACVFLQKPIDYNEFIKIIHKIDEITVNESYRVLIIDNSISTAEYYALLLQESNMITDILTNPLELFKSLAEFQPDLLLIELKMKECDGLEVAAVLHQEPRYMRIPIIFMCTRKVDAKYLPLSMGEDIISKSMLPQHILATIRSHIQRTGISTLSASQYRIP